MSELVDSLMYLFEGKDDVKKQYPLIPNDKFEFLLTLDPTYKGGDSVGKMTKWILTRYNAMLQDDLKHQHWEDSKAKGYNDPEPPRKSSDKPEDFEKLPELLPKMQELINKKKAKLDDCKSVADVATVVAENDPEQLKLNEKTQQRLQLFEKSIELGSEKLLDNDNWIVITTPTYECNHVFSQVTNWCTTSHDGHYFKHYLKEGGKYYVNMDKKTGNLYQFHFESKQYMNEYDRPIDIINIVSSDEELLKLYNTLYPDMFGVIYTVSTFKTDDEKYDYLISLYNDNTDVQKYVYVSDVHGSDVYVPSKFLKACNAIQNPSESLIIRVIKATRKEVLVLFNLNTPKLQILFFNTFGVSACANLRGKELTKEAFKYLINGKITNDYRLVLSRLKININEDGLLEYYKSLNGKNPILISNTQKTKLVNSENKELKYYAILYYGSDYAMGILKDCKNDLKYVLAYLQSFKLNQQNFYFHRNEFDVIFNNFSVEEKKKIINILLQIIDPLKINIILKNYSDYITDEIKYKIISRNPMTLLYCNVSDKILLKLLNKSPYFIRYIREPSPKIVNFFIKKYPDYAEYINTLKNGEL